MILIFNFSVFKIFTIRLERTEVAQFGSKKICGDVNKPTRVQSDGYQHEEAAANRDGA